jgi:hypothetical protein
MKFFLRYLPNGKILVKNTDIGSNIGTRLFSNIKDASEFIQSTVDSNPHIGAGEIPEVEDYIQDMFGGQNEEK